MRTVFTVPATLTLLAIGISAAHAAEEEIYEMITTAIHVRSSETALPVTVLANDALHDAVKATIGDTLSSQPGINNASFGPAVGQTVIRGQQGRRVMNLTNGLPNADASGNSADHAMTVEPILGKCHRSPAWPFDSAIWRRRDWWSSQCHRSSYCHQIARCAGTCVRDPTRHCSRSAKFCRQCRFRHWKLRMARRCLAT